MAVTRACGRCHKEKPLDEANYPHNKRGPGGFDRYCKACWREISAAKRNTPAARVVAGVRKAARVERRIRGWEEAREAPHAEVVPADVQSVPLKRLADLPSATDMLEKQGGLADAIATYEERFGVRPTLIYCPARFFMPYPEQDRPTEASAEAVKPARAGNTQGKKPRRGKQS